MYKGETERKKIKKNKEEKREKGPKIEN